MENLAPQSNENNKFITIIDGQDALDFDKNPDDSGKYFEFIVILVNFLIKYFKSEK